MFKSYRYTLIIHLQTKLPSFLVTCLGLVGNDSLTFHVFGLIPVFDSEGHVPLDGNWVVCGTVYFDIHYKDFLESIY